LLGPHRTDGANGRSRGAAGRVTVRFGCVNRSVAGLGFEQNA
jgi:hypothetical protein